MSQKSSLFLKNWLEQPVCPIGWGHFQHGQLHRDAVLKYFVALAHTTPKRVKTPVSYCLNLKLFPLIAGQI